MKQANYFNLIIEFDFPENCALAILADNIFPLCTPLPLLTPYRRNKIQQKPRHERRTCTKLKDRNVGFMSMTYHRGCN